MSDTPGPVEKNRRWFIILAIVTLIGFSILVGGIPILALRIPELKKSRYGFLEAGAGGRPP
mgnify:CR=1 FL=1